MSAITIEQQKSDKRTGAIATVVLHVLLILLFLFVGLQQPNPLPKDETIELVMEDMGGGGGSVAADTPGNPQPTPSATPAPVEPDEVATEEESPVAVPKPVKPNPKPAEPKPPKPNPNALFTPSSTKPSTLDGPPGGSQPSTTPGGGGLNRFGNGAGEWSLDGRGLAKTPSFRNDNTESGKVAVDIRVDPTGKVVYAKGRIGTPTTTTSSQLHAMAVAYAKQFTFSANPGASNDQAGFIVFDFRLQ